VDPLATGENGPPLVVLVGVGQGSVAATVGLRRGGFGDCGPAAAVGGLSAGGAAEALPAAAGGVVEQAREAGDGLRWQTGQVKPVRASAAGKGGKASRIRRFRS